MIVPDRQSLSLLALLLALVLAIRRIPAAQCLRFSGWGSGPAFPLAAGLLAASLTLWQWGGGRAVPVVHDEAAYLLQAELLASGRWSRPTPPLPEAFTQPAVLLTPVVAPMMPPGHAILLAPGVLMRIPGLAPILLVGLSGALLVVLIRRLAGAGTAALGLALWLTQLGQARWRASYFSENTTTALWLLGWWSLWRWRETGRMRWLLVLAAATGWGAITRPLTMLAYAIPVGIVVVNDVRRRRQWRQLAGAMTLGTAILMFLPVQNSAILRDWRASPLTLYDRQYSPSNKLGFGLDSTPPELAMPHPLARLNDRFIKLHREHQPEALSRVLSARLRVWYATNFWAWRQVLVPVALLALVVLARPAWFGVATSVGLYLAYLAYAHEPTWSLYYTEATPVSAGVIAIGLGWLVGWAAGPGARAGVARAAVAVVLFAWAAPDFATWRDGNRNRQLPEQRFRERVAALPTSRALIFLRYAPDHDPHASFLRNVADPATAPVITALDLGAAQRATLRSAYPDRLAFVWDEAADRFSRDSP